MTVLALLLLTTLGLDAAPESSPQIAGALAALPHATLHEGTEVRGYDADGQLVTLREGDGPFICLADDPRDELFHTACYHRSLDPFMQRGRELKAEGHSGKDRTRIRHEEVDAGTLAVPQGPAALSQVSGKSFDPASGAIEGANRIYVIYMPYATGASTGFPTAPNGDQPSAPWIMREGTPSAHVMITPGPVDSPVAEATPTEE